jgi:UDP-N-acetylmuramate dehydrogenase
MNTSLRLSAELIDELTAHEAVVSLDYSLSNATTFRLGGPCPVFIDCPNVPSLLHAWPLLLRHGYAPRLIGGGSNLLISDAGLNEIVVRYVEHMPDFKREEHIVTVSAGTLLDDFVQQTAAWGLDGLVVCSGIPGTVGGAIAGNAGAFGQQLGDTLVDIRVIDRDGNVNIRMPDELGFSYRRSNLPDSGDVIVSARFALSPARITELQARREEILALRAAKHPNWRTIPTAGSFFKNIAPTSNADRRQAAGWYLEQAGAMTLRVGGARCFERHANIVIVEPGGTANEVKTLTDRMAAAVKKKFGLVLEPEVKALGIFS